MWKTFLSIKKKASIKLLFTSISNWVEKITPQYIDRSILLLWPFIFLDDRSTRKLLKIQQLVSHTELKLFLVSLLFLTQVRNLLFFMFLDSVHVLSFTFPFNSLASYLKYTLNYWVSAGEFTSWFYRSIWLHFLLTADLKTAQTSVSRLGAICATGISSFALSIYNAKVVLMGNTYL